MSAALQPVPTPQPTGLLAIHLATLTDCRDRYHAQILAQLAALELAQAQGDEAEMIVAQIEITCALAARAKAAEHLERLGIPRQGVAA